MENTFNVLLLCNKPVRHAEASTVTDHISSFIDYSINNIIQLSFLRKLPQNIDFEQFDAIVIHYSLAIGHLSNHYIDDNAKQKIRDYTGLKAVFVQDEYRSVNAVINTINFLQIDLLFTCVPLQEIEKVYPQKILPNVRKVNVLTGYVPEKLLNVNTPKIKERNIDVGYRTRKPPYWLGELGYEKWQIADKFIRFSKNSGLKLDISYDESKRIYGKKWERFVSSCKTMLGVESGASVFDFNGGLQKAVDDYVAMHKETSFKEVQEKFLMPHEGIIKLNQISPRCFEAAALRTPMILFEGDYSGILKPDVHYIPLKKDFSNFNDILTLLTNHDYLESMANRTYLDIASNPDYSYKKFISFFDEILREEIIKRSKKQKTSDLNKLSFYIQIYINNPLFTLGYIFNIFFQTILLTTPARGILFNFWNNLPQKYREIIRPFLRLIGR